MILWFKHLPRKNFENPWKPVINSQMFRKHFMKAVYALQVMLAAALFWYCIKAETQVLVFLFCPLFVLHEICHIAVIYKLGDISITHKGLFFWINTNAEMSKKRFLLFMSMPIILLSIMPFLISFFWEGARPLLIILSLLNLIIAASDIINTIIIILKPRKSIFCAGFCKDG